VARHAQASNLNVHLTQKEDEVMLEVDDDGIGIQAGDIANPTSLGLLGMRERVAILGGQINFGPNEPRGTRVVVQIPINGKAGPLA
jgi:signal transduction histidine kinase